MKALVRHCYGPPNVLNVEEVPTPTARDDEVLVRVHTASVNLGDWELLTGQPRYLVTLARLMGTPPRYEVGPANNAQTRGSRTPRYKILGTDLAGRVEAVGSKVTRFQPGDEVFGDCDGLGAFAEYVRVPPAGALAKKPPQMSFEQAAAVPQAAFIALQALRDMAQTQPGQRVLINGAGGGAGTFAVQLAKSYGAHVTGVDGPHKLEPLRALGADEVFDYTARDFAADRGRYDVILDLVAERGVFRSRRALAPGGIYLMAGGCATALWQSVLLGPLLSRTTDARVAFLMARSRSDDLTHMVKLFEAGTVKPIMDACYPLDEAREAFRRVGGKRSFGKVVITL